MIATLSLPVISISSYKDSSNTEQATVPQTIAPGCSPPFDVTSPPPPYAHRTAPHRHAASVAIFFSRAYTQQVEMQFQPALDAYIAGREEGDLAGADAELAEATQWEDRCAFPFENFLPVFHLARSRGLPLVAMGVDRCVACVCVCVCRRGEGGGGHFVFG